VQRVLDSKVFILFLHFLLLPAADVIFRMVPKYRSSDPNEQASSDDKYNVVSSDYVVIEMNASH